MNPPRIRNLLHYDETPSNLVVGLTYQQRLKDGLRHAALKGLRPEKKPGLIRRSPMSERDPF